MPFKSFDPDVEVNRKRRNLPHWRQDGVTYFVTSRLADSIPKYKLALWKDERDIWLRAHGLTKPQDVRQLPKDEQRKFQRQFTKQWHEWLDAGMGACHLQRPDLAALVREQLEMGHPDDYELDAWVVMPNHFHALVTPANGVELSRILQRWKGASSRKINLALGRGGQLWQHEPFDHIVRSFEQLEHYRRYIADNPKKANLKEGTYLCSANFSL